MHIHSNQGIGEYKIADIFAAAQKKNLRAISITDLDTIRAYHNTNQGDADFYDLKLIRGVEIGASAPALDLRDVRILAYNFLLHHRGLNNLLKDNHSYRWQPGRTRNADWGNGLASIREVARQVKDAGGMTFLDPSSISADIDSAAAKLEFIRLMPHLKNWGVDGIEISNGRITQQESEFLSGLANEYEMAKIYGSGFIGRSDTPDISIGKCRKEEKLTGLASGFPVVTPSAETAWETEMPPVVDARTAMMLYEEPKDAFNDFDNKFLYESGQGREWEL